mgnify:FL=1
MPCYRPLDAYILAGRTKNGKAVISFKRENGWMDRIQLPCGQCIGCRLLKSTQWALRMEHEMSLHNENCFITLTYNEQNLPKDNSLQKDHFVKFMKRLRKEISPTKVRYFMCGEYGDETWRPHYHAILFGYAFPDKMQVQSMEVDQPYFLSPLLSKLWQKGQHTIAEANFTTAAYVARYVTKKITGDMADEHYTREFIDFDEYTGEIKSYLKSELLPEYATMSRRPGIGKGWYDKYKTDCYPSDYLVKDGKYMPVPKYYDKLLEREDEVLLQQLKFKRTAKALRSPDNTYERLIAREHCKHKQTETLKRNKI